LIELEIETPSPSISTVLPDEKETELPASPTLPTSSILTYETSKHGLKKFIELPPPVVLRFDNAPSHKSKMTKTFLKEAGISTLSAPPYSPDLAPSDFFLFGFLKTQLKGMVFKTAQELKGAVDAILRGINTTTLKSVFDNWGKRCLEVMKDGEYHGG
jgi:hypothetical protein